MENQHRKINGYRELNHAEIDLMNKIKSFGTQLQDLVTTIEKYIAIQEQTTRASLPTNTEQHLVKNNDLFRLAMADPSRWVNKGKDSLQEGLMFLTRAIAQPEFF